MSVSDYQAVIGLEVHAQLLTRSKIFCGCSTKFGAPPNHNTCPVCLGMPGTLPVLNRRVVEFAIRAGLALGCTIRLKSIWARKNYFYPDLPKGYQITQYDQPICENGRLAIEASEETRDIRIRRIHMEEDAGKSTHDAASGQSLIDFNRAGVPLLEIVSEPDLQSSEEAAQYLRQLRDVLVYLEINDGNMEEGSFRCDANVSLRRRGASALGIRTELKNMNSFRFVKQAIDYELMRQAELLDRGEPVVQQTRLWDTQRGETRPMRSKEEAHDYRYFPEPDLPPLEVSQASVDAIAGSLPELPQPKMRRFQAQYGLPAYDVKILCAERPLADFFEACAALYGDYKKLSNWFLGELLRLRNEEGGAVDLKIRPERLAGLLGSLDRGEISASAAKEVFGTMFRTGGDPRSIIEARGLGQISDAGLIESAVDEAIAQHPGEAEKYRAGKKQVLGFFVGQVMRAMQGKGNPALINELLKKKLG